MSFLQNLMPFTNDIANILTVSDIPGFNRFYVECPTNFTELGAKTIIDVITLIGIIWSVCLITAEKGLSAGFANGIMVIIVAFVIPNIFMERVVNGICGNEEDDKCNRPIKFTIAALFIILLVMLEHYLSHFLNEILEVRVWARDL